VAPRTWGANLLWTAGPVEQRSGQIDADHARTAARQFAADSPMPAGEVEHALASRRPE